MSASNLENIKVTQLSTFDVEGGSVLHAIKKDDIGYKGLGEVYFSFINPNAIKAWKLHKRMTLNLVVPLGKVRFVFCHSLNSGYYRVEDVGEGNYVRLTVPPNIWFGFMGISEPSNLVVNVASIEHDDTEVISKDLSEIKHDWK